MTRLFPFVLILASLLSLSPPLLASPVHDVVATTEDLAALLREVGGERVRITAIARGYQDPHFVEPKPSYLMKLKKADLLVAVGLELESGWLPALVTGSRNRKLLAGGGGYLDSSVGVEILDKPTGRVDRSMGDVHPEGNPHYWLDPENGRAMARQMAERLSRVDPEGTAHYQKRLADFEKRLDAALARWRPSIEKLNGTEVVAYHNSWPNLAQFLGLDVVGFIEPKPGIPPSPAHTLDMIQLIEEHGIRAILVEPYFDRKTPDEIARRTGAEVVVLYPSVGGTEAIDSYIGLFETNIQILMKVLDR